MGNCSAKGVAVAECPNPNSIRIMTDSGSIIEFEGPKFVGEVISGFPGYGIFGQGHISSRLLDHEQLRGGRFYYLLPLGETTLAHHREEARGLNKESVRTAHPLDVITNMKNGLAVEVLPPPQKGVWRVKLVIDTKQLEEILSEEVNTEALIEQMRLAATSSSVTPKRTKIGCGQGGVSRKPIRSPDY
ncbi:hypothetical protein CsSME_00045229 [Camellia sinensis var. sinensis]|uniref:Uncharacterized protein n=1 Tax=Camellia sinensis TaxID=4442 RepID=A0A7J7GD96_CAMSI|nr:hypothetical protein HYC85_022786 [Camellia sinensis]